jgi:hypothetical protein
MPTSFRGRWLPLYLLAAALLFAALMLVGIWRHHSAIPFLDMWDAYLGFYSRAGAHASAWWEQHNEHRLIVPRLIFWADLRLFGGSMTLLYALNALFPLLIAGCFAFLLGRLLAPGATRRALAALLLLLATSWVQSENFTWAFQSQFFLAYLLPLAAFTLLSHAAASGRRASFWLAWLAGLASAGTMANGVLALPLLLAQALLLRLGRRDAAVLALTTAVALGLYFHGYHIPVHYDAPESDVARRWWDVLRYLLLYLGGPWYFVLQKLALWPAMLAGALWLALAGTATWRVLRQRPPQPYALALLALLAYLGATALGAARGRIILGVEQALSSRYLTPQLMAWCALLLLALHLWPRAATSRSALALYAALPLALLPAQWPAARVPDYYVGLRIPALAVQLGVHDLDLVRQMSYEGERTFALAEQARREHLAVFGQPDMRLALAHWDGAQAPAPLPPSRCEGHIETLEAVPGEPDVVRLRGWLYDPQQQRTPSLVLLAGSDGTGRGAAVSGMRRTDVARAHGAAARFAGIGGYLQRPALDTPALLLVGWAGQQPACTLRLDATALPPRPGR